MMDKVMPGLKQIFLNGQNGHPLLHTTHPGDASLREYIQGHILAFEQAIGKEVVNFVVVDNEGCSDEMLKAFEEMNVHRAQKIFLITHLRNNQYRLEKDFRVRIKNQEETDHRLLKDGDFHPFQKDRRGRVVSKVALAEFNYYSNANVVGRKTNSGFGLRL